MIYPALTETGQAVCKQSKVLNKALQDAFVSLSMQSSCTAVMINHLQSAELIELHIVESV